MSDILNTWLANQGIAQEYLAVSHTLLAILLLLITATVSYYLTKNYLLEFLTRWVDNTQNSWDDLLAEHHVFSRIATLVPIIVVLALTANLLGDNATSNAIVIICQVGICFQTARCISAFLNVIKNTYLDKAHEKYLPLNATIQVLKLAAYIVAFILAIALIIDRSPLYLLSGLGALTAVLLLVFQDTIKGLVASIQISANKMLAPGDWIEMPSYGANGDVLEIGLNTVKVKNFDNTISTVPTYALISQSFINWRGMVESQGRRIKRAIIIDVNSIAFYNNTQLEQLKEIQLITDYLNEKLIDIASTAPPATSVIANHRQLTNIGTFRAYIERYLINHKYINHNLTTMVRQLPPTTEGIPLELYCFSTEKNWLKYEHIQADIFDHILAIAPTFGLRIFQQPSGLDWQKVSKNMAKH